MQLNALELEKELEIASRNVSEATEKIIRIDRDISVNTERATNLGQNAERFDAEVISIDGQIEENTNLRTQIEKSIIERERTASEERRRELGSYR
jgi:hypothetical protein